MRATHCIDLLLNSLGRPRLLLFATFGVGRRFDAVLEKRAGGGVLLAASVQEESPAGQKRDDGEQRADGQAKDETRRAHATGCAYPTTAARARCSSPNCAEPSKARALLERIFDGKLTASPVETTNGPRFKVEGTASLARMIVVDREGGEQTPP